MELLVFAAIFLAIRAYQQRGVAQGQAPDLSGYPTVEGSHISLTKYRGAPVAVHFWASWCGVCKASQGNVTALAEDLPVVTIATQSGGLAAVQKYLDSRPMGAPVVVDFQGRLARQYGVRAFPTTFVLDAEGNIAHTEVGYGTELGLRARMWLANW